MQAWKRIEPTTVRRVGRRTIVTKTFEMPDGRHETFDIKDAEGFAGVAIIALTPENKVLVFRQFRPGPEQIMDEVPGGFVDEGEKPETAARRELREETGYEPGEMIYISSFHKDTYMNAVWHTFLATNCKRVAEKELEAEEDIELQLISIDQLIKNAKADKMTDALAVFLAYDKLLALKGAAK